MLQSRKNVSLKKTKKSFKKLRKTNTQKRNRHTRIRHTRIRHSRAKHMRKRHSRYRHHNQKGGGILPSSVSQLGYSVMGAGQSIVDGWNGESSSFSYVNPSPEIQNPVKGGIYKANHNII
jgi:hypothetical protein